MTPFEALKLKDTEIGLLRDRLRDTEKERDEARSRECIHCHADDECDRIGGEICCDLAVLREERDKARQSAEEWGEIARAALPRVEKLERALGEIDFLINDFEAQGGKLDGLHTVTRNTIRGVRADLATKPESLSEVRSKVEALAKERGYTPPMPAKESVPDPYDKCARCGSWHYTHNSGDTARYAGCKAFVPAKEKP